jgi:prepilin-type N-terminal cleavage/methylation domain-containing protein
MNGRRPSGFTLIELMLSVAIIGLLASMALPEFRSLQLRSRQAERRSMVRAIEATVDDLWTRDGRYPQGTADSNTFYGPFNPPLPASSTRRAWNASATNGDWSRLPLGVEGTLYYSYYVYASASAGSHWRFVYVLGDLDGNGEQSVYWRQMVEYVVGTTTVRDFSEYDSAAYMEVF